MPVDQVIRLGTTTTSRAKRSRGWVRSTVMKALDGTTAVRPPRIQVDAPVVELPTASFTSTGATLQSLDVTGATTMSTLTANDVTACNDTSADGERSCDR
jgi:hypothetical protein